MEEIPDGDLMGYIMSQCPLLGSPNRQNTPSHTPFVPQSRTLRGKKGRNSSGNEQAATENLVTSPAKSRKSRRSLGSPQKNSEAARKSLSLSQFIIDLPKTNQKTRKSAGRNVNFEIDDFPTLTSDETSQITTVQQGAWSRKKRITVTPVENARSDSKGFKTASVLSSPTKIMAKERQLLRAKREEDDKSSPIPKISEKTPIKMSAKEEEYAKQFVQKDETIISKNKLNFCSNNFEIKAMDINSSFESPSKKTNSEIITKKDELLQLSNLFAHRFKNQTSLVGSFHGEIEFLFGLLTIKSAQEDRNSEKLLNSVENCAFFAAKTLEQLLPTIVPFLDSETLVLLAQNHRLNMYAELQILIKPKTPKNSSEHFNSSSFAKEVTRSQFPDQNSFHTFKSQRDEFAMIFSDWNREKDALDFSFGNIFGSRIEKLLKIGPHTLNYALMAEIFINKFVEEEEKPPDFAKSSDIISDQLSKMGLTDPERAKRLQDRMDRPEPIKTAFSGKEAFFKDFILHANNTIFTQLLKDYLLAKLLNLQITTETIKNPDLWFESAERMGKFLGYLWFLPYQQLKSLPHSLQEPLLQARSQDQLPTLLNNALNKQQNLATLISWLSSSLFFADSLILEVKAYKDLTLRLHCLLREMTVLFYRNPSSLLFYLCSQLSETLQLPQFSRIRFLVEENIMEDHFHLDECFDEVDWEFSCDRIAWIERIKKLLSSFAASNSGQHNPTRKINPLKLESSPPRMIQIFSPESPMKNRHLETQLVLEKQFFTQQPVLLRKIIDNGAECMAEKTIRTIKMRMAERIAETVPKIPSEPELFTASGFILPTTSSDIAHRILHETLVQELNVSDNKLEDAVSMLMESLKLSTEIIEVGIKIQKRWAEEKVQTWMRRGHAREWLLKEVRAKVKKSDVKTEPKMIQEFSVASLLQELRETHLQIELGENPGKRMQLLLEKCEKTELAGYPDSVEFLFKAYHAKLKKFI